MQRFLYSLGVAVCSESELAQCRLGFGHTAYAIGAHPGALCRNHVFRQIVEKMDVLRLGAKDLKCMPIGIRFRFHVSRQV